MKFYVRIVFLLCFLIINAGCNNYIGVLGTDTQGNLDDNYKNPNPSPSPTPPIVIPTIPPPLGPDPDLIITWDTEFDKPMGEDGKIKAEDCKAGWIPRFYAGPFGFVTQGYGLREGTTFSDSLKGSSKGSVSGGEFVSDGWRTKTEMDYITYDTNDLFRKDSISKGFVEFWAKGWGTKVENWALINSINNQPLVDTSLPKTEYNPNQYQINPKRGLFTTYSGNVPWPTSATYKFSIRLYGYDPQPGCLPTYQSPNSNTCYCYEGELSDVWGILKVRLGVDENPDYEEESVCPIPTTGTETQKREARTRCFKKNGHFEEYLLVSNEVENFKDGNLLQDMGSGDILPLKWDETGNTWYKFRIEWGNGIARVYVNGVVVTQYDYSVTGKEFAPPNQKIRIGFGEFAAPLGVTFRDVKIVDLTEE